MNRGNLNLPAAIALTLFVLWFSGASADPFPWSQARIENGKLCLADGTDVTYRSASILQGGRFEVAVMLEWNSVDRMTTQEIVHEMADSPPLLSVYGELVKVNWTVFPIGADNGVTISTCWHLAQDRRAFIKSPCDSEQAADKKGQDYRQD
ncbi:MAG: hypothetical protein GY701_31925 [Sulfitobacter sp.]|nr:hypothetical protein [Sulfitobacter sp.]